MTKVQYVDNFNLALTQATLAEKLRQAQKDVHDFNKFLEDRYLEKAKEKLKLKKYNPNTRKHEYFVEKKLPPHSK